MRNLTLTPIFAILYFVALTTEVPNARAESYDEILMTMKRYQQSKNVCHSGSKTFDVHLVWDAVLSSKEIVGSFYRAAIRLRDQAECAIRPYGEEAAEAPVLVQQTDAALNIEILILAANLDIAAESALFQKTFRPEIFDGVPLIELMPNGEWSSNKRVQDYWPDVPYVGPITLLRCNSGVTPSAKAIPSRYLIDVAAYACPPAGQNHTELRYLGLGNFVSWGDFRDTHQVAIEHAAFPALEFEIYRALQEILAR
jgi:hypothetical protein